jgi:SAM-dependent methyltransferase
MSWNIGDHDEFARRAWELALHRAPDDGAGERLRRGTVSRARLLRELVESREFERVELLDDGLARALAPDRGRPRELRAPAWSDERAVEIPWVLARYEGQRRVLDVGYAFAEPAYLAGLVALGAEELVGVDLAGAEVEGLRSVVADVRDLPFDAGSFDLVTCISTLEHIGRDNDVYAVDAPRDDEGDIAALREIHRVLASDGRALVTVPTGEHDDLGWQVQRPAEDWIERFEAAGFLVYEDELYVRGDDGWRSATPAETRGVRYRGSDAGAVLLAELRPRRVVERLRLAVRDVKHRDEPRRSTL